MHSVNNCLTMSINSDASEIALDKIKNILISFDKKKRNLEKRKNKLDEYKKKANLNEDQQAAVAKYPEVMSNLELLDELTTYTIQQLKDAEKSIKKNKKQDKIDRKRCEAQLIEFILKNYSVLERIGSNERLRQKLIAESVISEKKLEAIMDFVSKMNLSDRLDWKLCIEHMHTLYENTNINIDIVTSEDKKLRAEELLSIINNLTKIEWLWINDVEDCISNSGHLEQYIEIPVVQENIQCGDIPVVEERVVDPEPISPCIKPIIDNPKLSFVFLHDSIVQHDLSKIVNENGSNQVGSESEDKTILQTSAGNMTSTWQTESNIPSGNVDDVFSSATQSEFMRSENAKNAWAKNIRVPSDVRFRNRTNVSSSFTHSESQANDTNYRRADRGAFIPNSRFARQNRGRGRGWGRHDNQQISDALPSQ